MNPRDSRVVSIYDKYLYDPKDLESSDPRRRELLVKPASSSSMVVQPTTWMPMDCVPSVLPQSSCTAQKYRFLTERKSSRRSHSFSGNAASQQSQRNQQKGQRPSYASASSTHDRDSGAFGLGLGMLGGSDSESDSDSEDERSKAMRNAAQINQKQPQEHERPESWTDRAVAVGHRPLTMLRRTHLPSNSWHSSPAGQAVTSLACRKTTGTADSQSNPTLLIAHPVTAAPSVSAALPSVVRAHHAPLKRPMAPSA